MVGECVGFLFTTCEGSLNSLVRRAHSSFNDPSQVVNKNPLTNHEVISIYHLLYSLEIRQKRKFKQ